MIYEIIVFDSDQMKPIAGYAPDKELKMEEITQRTGLVSLINLALNQLANNNLADMGNVVDLKTDNYIFSFKVAGKFIISIKGTHENENRKVISRLVSDIKDLKNTDEIKRKLEDSVKKNVTVADEFRGLWG